MFTRTVLATIVCVAALLSSGCMTYPGHGETIGQRSSRVQFSGYTQTPNQLVAVWAKRWDGSWHHLGTVRTANWTTDYFQTSWYSWSLQSVIPNNCWNYGGYGNTPYFAEIAATSSAGELYTFDRGFGGYLVDYDNVIDMYNDHGAGTRMTVYARP
jgi:hypothetical protein